jgi:hypothetical protein
MYMVQQQMYVVQQQMYHEQQHDEFVACIVSPL